MTKQYAVKDVCDLCVQFATLHTDVKRLTDAHEVLSVHVCDRCLYGLDEHNNHIERCPAAIACIEETQRNMAWYEQMVKGKQPDGK